jgi:hypothetical protein
MTGSTVDSGSPAAARRQAWLAAVERRVRRDGFACVRVDGKPRIVVESYTDGFNLVSSHGIPVRLAMLRGLHYGVRDIMRRGPLAEDYLDLFGIWCGLLILREVVKRKKLVWGRGDKAHNIPLLGSNPRLMSRTKARARKKGGEMDLLSLVPTEFRPFHFHEVSVPRIINRVFRRSHEVLFTEGPTLAAQDLHLAILQELHISYRQPWTPETEEQAKRLLAKNRPVKVGERDLVYHSSDLAQLLAYYGVGKPAPVNRVRRYTIQYWNLDVLLGIQATPKLVDLRTIPWMRERYTELKDLASRPVSQTSDALDAPP